MIEVSGRASPQTGTTALSRPWLGTQGLPAKAPSSPPSPWNLRQAPPRRLVDGHGDGKTDPHDYSSEPFHRRICWDAPQLDQVPPTHTPQCINKQNSGTQPFSRHLQRPPDCFFEKCSQNPRGFTELIRWLLFPEFKKEPRHRSSCFINQRTCILFTFSKLT